MTGRRQTPPWIAIAADVAALVLVASAAVLLLAGPYRKAFGETIVSVGWEHAAFAALAIAAIRHAALPTPSIRETIAAAVRYVSVRPALADALAVFTLTRPFVLIVGLAAIETFGVSPTAPQIAGGRYALAELPSRFDANWYAGIAADGYEWQYRFDRQQNLAFFPAYPIIVRTVGRLTGAFAGDPPREWLIVRLTWCGLIVSLGAFLWACWYLSRLAREIIGPDRARSAVLLLGAYPFAVFFSAAYTEPVFLLAALGAWYHLRHREWLKSAAWGLLAGLVRPNGFLLSVPLALVAMGFSGPRASLEQAPSDPPWQRWLGLAAASMPGVGMMLYTGYLYQRTGVWFAWTRMHGAWGRTFGGNALGGLVEALGSDGFVKALETYPYDAFNALGLAFALALVWPVWRRVGAAWAVFVLASLLPPFFAGGLLSMGRLSSTLFPSFLALASLLPSRAVLPVAVGFGVLQAVAAALFYTWRDLF